jgi:hypothetical protein
LKKDFVNKSNTRKEIGIDETKKKNKSAIRSIHEMDASMVHPIVWTHYRNDEHRALSWKGG